MNFVSLFAQSSYYTPNTVAVDDSGANLGVMIVVWLFMLMLVIASYVITSFLLSKIFKKAGVEAWKAWVPVYNNWITLELGGQKGYWSVLAFIPFVNIVSAVFMYIAMYHIGLRLGKEGVFVLLAIFIPLAWYVWLAFDNSTWKGPRLTTQVEDTTTTDTETPTKPIVK